MVLSFQVYWPICQDSLTKCAQNTHFRFTRALAKAQNSSLLVFFVYHCHNDILQVAKKNVCAKILGNSGYTFFHDR